MIRFLLTFCILLPLGLSAQLSTNEKELLAQLPAIEVQTQSFGKRAPNIAQMPQLFAVSFPLERDVLKAGKWFLAENKRDSVLAFRIHSDRPYGHALTFSEFSVPPGGALYILGEREELLPVTRLNTGAVPSEFVSGDEVFLLYYHTSGAVYPKLKIESLDYAVDELRYLVTPYNSQYCEIDVNCEEGDAWQKEKRSVVRILARSRTSSGVTVTYNCSGTLMNNTSNSNDPLVLTADHCATVATGNGYEDLEESFYEEWKFYFNFERVSCESFEATTGDVLQGAQRLAWSGTTGDIDPDFHLVRLTSPIPDSYNAYYAGWSRYDITTPSGVVMHHPQGDYKKISTFTEASTSSQYLQTVKDTHWKVRWSSGTTEGGSSGSGLFNADHLMVGILTGGQASCFDPLEYDFFGKFARAWEWGTSPEKQLKPWLDPEDKGVFQLQGREAGDGGGIVIPQEPHRVVMLGDRVQGYSHFQLQGLDVNKVEWLQIVDYAGRPIKKYFHPESLVFPLAEFVQGVYVIQYYYEGEAYSNKILVTKY